MPHDLGRTAHLLLSLCGLTCGATATRAQVVVDGVSFVDRAASGEIQLGNLRGSLAVIDYDRDGWQDLFILDTVGKTHRLFHNVHDAAHPGRRTFIDVTANAGLNDLDSVQRDSGGVLAGDVDNDGWPDLYALGNLPFDGTNGVLYHNNGNGTFTNVSVASGLRYSGGAAMSCSFVDYDLDGRLDLFLAAAGGAPGSLRMFRNIGNGKFADATAILPPPLGATTMYSHLWTDFDADGDPDCVLLSPGGSGPRILRNTLLPNGSRTLVAVGAEVGYSYLGPAPMGIAAGDYDGDGDLDLAITDAAVGTYYRNDAGVLTRITPFDSIFGWGVAWLDADNDGDLDNYQAGSYPRSANVDQLFRNLGNGTFDNITPALNTSPLMSQYSVQVDWNNDGRPEMVTVNPGTPGNFVSVYENTSTTPGHWLTIHARGDGVRVNRDAVGAIVRLTAGGRTQTREIINGSSTTSTEDLRAHFGLGDATAVDRVEITWPRVGTTAERTQVFSGPITPDRFITLDFRCPADFDADGFVTGDDFDAYVEAFAVGTPGADFNRDGFVTGDDFDQYVAVYEGGC